MAFRFLVVFLAVFLVGAGPIVDERITQLSPEELEGWWTATSVCEDGVPMDVDLAQSIWLRIEPRTFSFANRDFGYIEFSRKGALDPEKGTFDLPYLGNGIRKGIYSLRDDRLVICLGKARPKGFKAPKGSEQVLIVFQRLKRQAHQTC